MDTEELQRSEREAWQLIHAKTKRGSAYRRRNHEQFATFFPEGHRTSLREIVTYAAEVLEGGLNFVGTRAYLLDQVHPRALRLIEKHGKDYWPLTWRGTEIHTDTVQPQPRSCAADAIHLARLFNRTTPGRTHITYVEGITFGPDVPIMLHAWNARGWGGKCRDWSHYSVSHWSRYIGIPFTLTEWEELRMLIAPQENACPLLFADTHFPLIEGRVVEILEKRKG